MDRVYARLITMSILLSLCGAGFVVPGGKLAMGARDVLLAVDANGDEGLSVRDVKRVQGADHAAGCCGFRRQLGMVRLRLALSGFSARFASWCKRSIGVSGSVGADSPVSHPLEVSAGLCCEVTVDDAPQGVALFFPPFGEPFLRQPLVVASPSRAGPVCA